MRLPLLPILVSAVLASSGCMCCGTDLSGVLNGGAQEAGEGRAEACESPYMQVGSECCLDYDGNGVCDSDEAAADETEGETETTDSTEETATTLAEETMTLVEADPTTTTGATATTQRTNGVIYNCVKAAGYDPEKVIYLSSKSTGKPCGSDAITINSIKTAASRSGVEMTFEDISYLEEDEIRMMECFFGRYSEGNLEFRSCPRLLCPRNGNMVIIDGRRPIVPQASGFMKNCG